VSPWDEITTPVGQVEGETSPIIREVRPIAVKILGLENSSKYLADYHWFKEDSQTLDGLLDEEYIVRRRHFKSAAKSSILAYRNNFLPSEIPTDPSDALLERLGRPPYEELVSSEDGYVWSQDAFTTSLDKYWPELAKRLAAGDYAYVGRMYDRMKKASKAIPSEAKSGEIARKRIVLGWPRIYWLMTGPASSDWYRHKWGSALLTPENVRRISSDLALHPHPHPRPIKSVVFRGDANPELRFLR
jgi:hypothetical protein